MYIVDILNRLSILLPIQDTLFFEYNERNPMYRKIETLYLSFSLMLYAWWLFFKQEIIIYVLLSLLTIVMVFGVKLGYSYYMVNTRIGVRGDATFFWHNLLSKPNKIYYVDCKDTYIFGFAKADVIANLQVSPEYKLRNGDANEINRETTSNKYRLFKCKDISYNIEVYERTPDIVDNLKTLFKKGK